MHLLVVQSSKTGKLLVVLWFDFIHFLLREMFEISVALSLCEDLKKNLT